MRFQGRDTFDDKLENGTR